MTFSMSGEPDVPFTPLIISRGPETLGVLNTNIVPEFISSGGTATDITEFGDPPFTPSHFKPLAINGTVGSGIGHQTFTGNQKKVARKKCVRVSFSQYQEFVDGELLNVNAGKLARKCVVFRTK